MFAVLRNMRFERSIIHRDISKGNVLYTGNGKEDSTTSAMLSAKKGPPKQMRYCFIKYLLRERYVKIYCNWVAADTESSDDPTATSVLLIDFNHAEDLKSKENDQRTPRTVGCIPVTICDYAYLPCFRVHPSSLLVLFSEEDHWTSPATLEFSLECPVVMNSTLRSIRIELEISRIKRKTCCMGLRQTVIIAKWRHDLDHDAESVFWLLYYWAMCAQPVGHPEERLSLDLWASMTGCLDARIERVILMTIYQPRGTHSLYTPLRTLLGQLAAILRVDGHWLGKSDPRHNLGYITEAFQRLIFNFVVKHYGENFMCCRVEQDLRKLEDFPQVLYKPSPTSQLRDAGARKRVSSQQLLPESRIKRSRHDRTADEGEAGMSLCPSVF